MINEKYFIISNSDGDTTMNDAERDAEHNAQRDAETVQFGSVNDAEIIYPGTSPIYTISAGKD